MSLLKRKRMTAFFSFLFFLAVISFLLILFPKIASQTMEEKQRTLEDALYRASIQCYSIEGRYPPSISYLEEHYGIVIDHKQFQVFYDTWADNIMPDITVILIHTFSYFDDNSSTSPIDSSLAFTTDFKGGINNNVNVSFFL